METSKCILIVDDDDLTRRSVTVHLRKKGYGNVIDAENGKVGLEKYRRFNPDLTLLDLRMPELDGLEFLQEVQEDLEEIPVIILSGAGSIDDVIKSLQYGAWDYILKPINDFSMLNHSITKALERAELIRQNKRHQEYLEEEVRKRTKELYQAQKMEAIGTLAGGVAHDFNNMLASMIGYTEMAMEQLPPDGQPYRDLENVLDAANSATDLVKQILTFSRQDDVDVHPVRVQEVLRQAIKLLKSTFPASITIYDEINQNCKPVLADSSQIQQVVMNLCTNAKQAMENESGTITIGLDREDSLPESITPEPGQKIHAGYLRLRVADTGKGIESEVIDKIFEPFYTTKPIGKGTGLGLSVVHGIVTGMDGVIAVESAPGRGTEFSIYIPVVDVFENVDGKKTAGHAAGGSERILLVDDDPRLVRVLDRALTGLGYSVTSTTDSMTALEKFTMNPAGFDLVITDMTMPRLTGRELAVKMLAVRPDIPVIICTGYSEVMDTREAKLIGIRKFVMKPVAKHDLAAIIRTVLDNG